MKAKEDFIGPKALILQILLYIQMPSIVRQYYTAVRVPRSDILVPTPNLLVLCDTRDKYVSSPLVVTTRSGHLQSEQLALTTILHGIPLSSSAVDKPGATQMSNIPAPKLWLYSSKDETDRSPTSGPVQPTQQTLVTFIDALLPSSVVHIVTTYLSDKYVQLVLWYKYAS